MDVTNQAKAIEIEELSGDIDKQLFTNQGT